MRLAAPGLLIDSRVVRRLRHDADNTRSSARERVERYFDDYLALNPTDATDIGDHRFDDRLEIDAVAAYEIGEPRTREPDARRRARHRS